MLLLVWVSYLATRMLMRDPHVGAATPTRAHQSGAETLRGAATDIRSQQAVAWSALDERQLTRLLIDAAAATNDE